MSKSVQNILGFLLIFALLAGSVSAKDVELSWAPSESTGVVAGYKLYIGSSRLGLQTAEAIDVGLPPVDTSGIATALVSDLDRSLIIGFEMTSYDALGRESIRSNMVILDAPDSERIGSSIYFENFTGLPVGVSPEGFELPAGAFLVAQFPDGNLAAAGQATAGSVVAAEYIGSPTFAWRNYEVTGKLMLFRRTGTAGIAVRADTNLGSYFGFGGDGSGEFALSQAGKVPLSCALSTSTGKSVVANSWFRFRLRVTEPSSRTRLRGKFWPVGQAEPVVWLTDCWVDVTLPLGSGELALYTAGLGRAYWDDLNVKPVLGAPQPIPVP